MADDPIHSDRAVLDPNDESNDSEKESESLFGRISRRSFLSHLGAAGIAATAPPLFAATQTPEAPAAEEAASVPGTDAHHASCERQRLSPANRSAGDVARLPARESEASRHQEGLRPRSMRRLHGSRQRAPSELLPLLCRDAHQRSDHDH